MKTTASPKKRPGKSPGPASDRDAPAAAAMQAEGSGGAAPADALPGKEEIFAVQAAMRVFMRDPGQARARAFLKTLSLSPPQVLLLEGGTADERLASAHYWALLLNCPGSRAAAPEKPRSRPGPAPDSDPESRARSGESAQIRAPENGAPAMKANGSPTPTGGGLLALLADASPQAEKAPKAAALSLGLPGLASPNSGDAAVAGRCPESAIPGRADPDGAPIDPMPAQAGAPSGGEPCLECPECVRMLTHLHRDCFFFDGLAGSIKIDEVRAMRAVLGEPAREARCRIVILREAQALVEAAANALLKSLEEPRPGTSFVLLAPQRERLLPTLVSRSFVLTLPWPRQADPEQRDRLAPWEAALCSFLQNGRDFFERSGAKGAVDAALAHDLTNLCRRILARRLSAPQSGALPEEGLDGLLAGMPAQRLRMLDEALAECQDSLIYNVNPTLVLEWLATRMYLLLPRPAGGTR